MQKFKPFLFCAVKNAFNAFPDMRTLFPKGEHVGKLQCKYDDYRKRAV